MIAPGGRHPTARPIDKYCLRAGVPDRTHRALARVAWMPRPALPISARAAATPVDRGIRPPANHTRVMPFTPRSDSTSIAPYGPPKYGYGPRNCCWTSAGESSSAWVICWRVCLLVAQFVAGHANAKGLLSHRQGYAVAIIDRTAAAEWVDPCIARLIPLLHESYWTTCTMNSGHCHHQPEAEDDLKGTRGAWRASPFRRAGMERVTISLSLGVTKPSASPPPLWHRCSGDWQRPFPIAHGEQSPLQVSHGSVSVGPRCRRLVDRAMPWCRLLQERTTDPSEDEFSDP